MAQSVWIKSGKVTILNSGQRIDTYTTINRKDGKVKVDTYIKATK